MIFAARLGLYLLLMGLPLLHPAVIQYGDTASLLRSLLLLPIVAILAWKPPAVGGRRRFFHLIALAGPLVFLPLLGFTATFFELFLSVQYAYWSTWLIFHRRITRLFYVDAFYFAVIIYRLLSLRSQESVAFNALALVLMFGGFITYAVLIYRLEFEAGQPRPKEVAISALLPLVLGLTIVFLLPPNFTQDIRTFNGLNNIIKPPLRPLAESENSPEDGSANGESGNEPDGTDSDAQVYLMPPDSWPGQSGRSGSEGSGGEGRGSRPQNQYMVMVVDSPVGTLYLADEYFNHQDEVRGFYSDPAFDLNRLTRSQYLETWQHPDPIPRRNRRLVEIAVYSTIREKVGSYLPFQIEPTIFDTTFYPLSYTYRSVSMVSNLSLSGRFPLLGELLPPEKAEVASYLDLSLPPQIEEDYRGIIGSIISEEDDYIERIRAILQYYRGYKYELGFTDNVSTAAISSFLFDTRAGDCTEFSNSAATLARLAGIPARVVTGYIVSDGLQTPAHLQALAELQRHYPPIAEKNLSSLHLVTSAHRHSWAQFYLPTYGWVDFETTAFAIPPVGAMNPNNLDVVIPDLEERRLLNRNLPIPWGFVLRFLLMAAAVGVVLFYSMRWSRLIRLSLVSQMNNERAYKALYRLLLIRLCARGYDLKSIDFTPQEYAHLYPELGDFMLLYTQLVFQQKNGDPLQLQADYQRLRAEYQRLLRKGRGALSFLREIFSLQDMRYL